MCLLNENVLIDWKYAYWIKMCLLKGYNPLGINSGSYSFDKFFLTSFSFIFLKKTKNLWVFSKITICKSVFFFFFGLNSEKVQESSHINGSNNNTEWFLHLVTSSLSSSLEIQKTCRSSQKLLFVSRFFLLNSEKIQESSHTKSNNNNTRWFLYIPYECYSYQILHFLRCALPMFFFSMIVLFFFFFFFFVLMYTSYVKRWVDTET